MSLSGFSIYWNIQNSGKYTGTPISHRVHNDLDAHGSFLDLIRLPSESNYSYFKRLQSIFSLRGGSDRDGLVHGITRELGLEESIGIIISPVQAGGKWKAPAPHVEITSTQVILYSSYLDSDNNTVDMAIDIFNHGEGYLLEDLVAKIQTSQYFVADLGSDMNGSEKSNGLFPGFSSSIESREWVPASDFFTLEHGDIFPGSLYFTEKEIFNTEISTYLSESINNGFTITWSVNNRTTRDGEYFVDYNTGIVTVHTSASGIGTCRYVYRNFPWYVRWSPVIVYSLRDNTYRDKLFEDEIMLDNSVKQGVVTSEGVDVYTQVFQKSPCLWGD